MSPVRGLLRVAILFWAIFQIALPPLAAVADADASVAGSAARAHVEDSSTGSCVQVHDAQCALCQYLTGCAAPIGDAAPSVGAKHGATRVVRPVGVLHTVEAVGFPIPRGPPQV